jgi:hypothetical protein
LPTLDPDVANLVKNLIKPRLTYNK